MLEKTLYKKQISRLFMAHGIFELQPYSKMLEMWYEECKNLKEEDYIKSVNRCFYSNKIPKLYDLLINLPNYNKDLDKTMDDYCYRNYEIYKEQKNTGKSIVNDEFIKKIIDKEFGGV